MVLRPSIVGMRGSSHATTAMHPLPSSPFPRALSLPAPCRSVVSDVEGAPTKVRLPTSRLPTRRFRW